MKKIGIFLMQTCSILFWISCFAFLLVMLGGMLYYAFQSIYFGLISKNQFKITISTIEGIFFLFLLLGVLFRNKQISEYLFKTFGYFIVIFFLILHIAISIGCIITPFTDAIDINIDLKIITLTPLFLKVILFIVGLYAAVRTYIFADDFLFSKKSRR